jgi:hypothetical protein
LFQERDQIGWFGVQTIFDESLAGDAQDIAFIKVVCRAVKEIGFHLQQSKLLFENPQWKSQAVRFG